MRLGLLPDRSISPGVVMWISRRTPLSRMPARIRFSACTRSSPSGTTTRRSRAPAGPVPQRPTSGLCHLELIAQSPHGSDREALLAAGGELAADALDVHIHRACVRGGLIPPHPLQQLLPRAYLALVRGQ